MSHTFRPAAVFAVVAMLVGTLTLIPGATTADATHATHAARDDAPASAPALADAVSALVLHDPGFSTEADCFGYRAWLSDELSGCLWHLNWQQSFNGQLGARPVGGDINIGDVWSTTRGANVSVAIVDDTWNPNHHDLRDNVDLARSHNYEVRPLPESPAAHATKIAGVIAARDNNLGSRGIAPRATLLNYNLVEWPSPSHRADAMRRNAATVAVSNHSYGLSSIFPEFLIPADSWWDAVDYGLQHGFGGKGTSYVVAAGNRKTTKPGTDVITDGMHAHPGVISACAVDNNGQETQYSQTGVSLWVCAPANGRDEQTKNPIGNYVLSTQGSDLYTGFGHTSVAAAEVSGVVALMRSANPYLTWRDVKLILAQTAQKNDPTHASWSDGAVQYGSSSSRYSFSPVYGFGVVDASAAVNAALTWKRLPALVTTTVSSGGPEYDSGHPYDPPDSADAVIDSNGQITQLTLSGPSDIDFLEDVWISLYLTSSHSRDLRIELVSPSGTTSRLVDSIDYRAQCGNSGWKQKNSCEMNYKVLRLSSSEFLGEDPDGTWTLKISDRITHGSDADYQRTRLYSWQANFLGHAGTSADTAPRARLSVNNLSGIDATVNEGSAVRVSASLTGGTLSQSVTIPVELEAGTATAPGGSQPDYSPAGPLQIKIPAGQTSGAATFNIINDGVSEQDETLSVKWPDPHGQNAPQSLVLLGDPIEVTIDGDLDPPGPARTVTLTATPSTVTEGKEASITATLSGGAWTRAIELPVSYGNGTATPHGGGGHDFYPLYDANSNPVTTITIPAGATSATYRFVTYEDDLSAGVEPDETAIVIARRPAALRNEVALVGSPLTITIVERDNTPPPPAKPVVSVSAGSAITEGGDATFTVSASPAPKAALSVLVSVAQNGSFGVSPGFRTVTVPKTGSATLTVSTDDDSTEETDGSVSVTVKDGNGYTASGSANSATVTVSDDDGTSPPVVPTNCVPDSTLEQARRNYDVNKDRAPGYGGNWRRVLVAFGDVEDDQVVPYTAAEATASEQRWSGWKPFREALECIEEADPPPPPPSADPEVSISGGGSVTEGGNASFTITASPAPSANLTVDVSVAQIGDFGVTTGTRTVTVPTTGSVTLTVSTSGDSVDESDGFVTVTVSSGSGYTVSQSRGTSTVAVYDDDAASLPVVSVAADGTVTEGSPATFTVSANPAPTSALTVDVSVAASGDFGVTTGTRQVTVPTSGSVTLSVSTSGDSADEADGSVTVTVSTGTGYTVSSTNSTATATVSDDDDAPPECVTQTPSDAVTVAEVTDWRDRFPGDTARVLRWNRVLKALGEGVNATAMTITESQANETVFGARWDRVTRTLQALEPCDDDDDDPPPTPVVSVAAGNTVTEGGNASFTVTANPAPTAALTVDVSVSAAGDFGVTTGTRQVTVPTAGSVTLSVSTSGDSVDEPHGSVTVAVTDGTGYTVSQTDGSASVTVSDDDDPPPPPPTPVVSIAAGNGVTEGSPATFTVTASPAPSSPLTVDVSVAQSGSFGVTTGTRQVTVPTAGSVTLSVSTSGDSTDEPNGSVTVTVSNATGYTVSSTNGSASVAVSDDDPTPPSSTPVVSITGGSDVSEGSSASFTVSASPAPSSPLRVDVTTAVKARFGTARGGRTVTIPTTGSATLTIATTNDSVDAPDGSVTVTLSSGTGYTVSQTYGTAKVTVLDDDDPAPPTPVVSIAAGNGVTEGSPATFTVSASPSPSSPLTVKLSVAQTGSFGVTTGTRTVTIPISGSVTLSVSTSGDSTDEPNGSVTVTLSSSSGYTVSQSKGSASVTVSDDDAAPPPPPPPSVTVSIGDASGEEGLWVTFKVTLSEAVDHQVKVRWESDHAYDLDPYAIAGSEFWYMDGTLTFKPGQTEKSASVYLNDDSYAEADELFRVRLSSPQGVTIADGEAVMTITDND